MGPSGTRSPSTALTTASAVNTSKASKVVSPNPGSGSGWIEVGGPKPVVTSSASGDRSKLNTSISSGSGLGALALQLSGATNPPGVPGATTLPSHPTHSLSPAPLTLQSPPTLAPPPQPMFAVPYYPYPAYGYPYAQYLGPGQGAWVAVYRPPNPPHPHSHPAHPVPITGASGMKHTSW
ncbi:hypothetical protein HYDPIDRAFT_27257 [Hydnomerulius pinastri MD-312]|nr:hypothetical protein HYDPIDRAFT_27257 [Hydnomerulius pinastri MD-312]